MRFLDVRRLGVVPYEAALAMQRELVEARRSGHVSDVLLLLQHPAVITVGVRGDGGRTHIVASDESLAARGIEVHETGRGGDVTYHGPGQLVAYPVLDLNPDRRDVHRYVRDLEAVMIGVCGEYGIHAARVEGLTGAWIGERKIGAIGVRISRWITSHGLAFNVATDLSDFSLIVPCGIADRGVTSLREETGRDVPMPEVEDALVRHFCRVFDSTPLTDG